MELINKLDESINDFLYTKGEVSVILIHPETYKNFILNINSMFNLPYVLSSTANIKYKGIKMRRSIDVEPNEFEVY